MDLAAIIRRLIDLDASTEVIALAIEAYEVGRSMSATVVRVSADKDDMSFDKDDRKRERDRLYRRKKRAMAGLNVVSAKANDVADTLSTKDDMSADKDDTSSTYLSSLLPTSSLKRTSKGRKLEVVAGARARGSSLSADWQPTEDDMSFARELGLDPRALRDEFVDYWIGIPGARGRKLGSKGWSSTYRNRARQIAGKSGRASSTSNGMLEVYRQLREKAHARDDSPDDQAGSAGAGDPRLL